MWEEEAGHHLVVVVERAKNCHVFRGRYRMPTHNVEVTRPDYFIRTGWVGIIGHVHFIEPMLMIFLKVIFFLIKNVKHFLAKLSKIFEPSPFFRMDF